MDKVILIKYGEIGLKGHNRPFFERALQKNIAVALGMNSASDVEVRRGRMYARYSDILPSSILGTRQSVETLKNLSRVFGIVSFAVASKIPLDAVLLKQESPNAFCSVFEEKHKTFRVTAHRAEKRFPFDSMKIQKEIGGVILEKFPHLKVNLFSPDIELFIEIRREGIMLYTNLDEQSGPGGLPVGTGGRGLLLLSGGIDSPVAGWMMTKRGMEIDAAYFHTPPYTGDRAKEKVVQLARTLSRWKLAPVKLFIVPFSDVMVEINKKCLESLWTVLHRRAMMRVAEEISGDRTSLRMSDLKKLHYDCLITGENLGQVASQTIENISVIGRNIEVPIIRPLIGFDKEEIIAIAKKIDTYRISTLPYEDCCTVFAPQHPTTKAKHEHIEYEEKKLDAEVLIRDAAEKIKQGDISENGT